MIYISIVLLLLFSHILCTRYGDDDADLYHITKITTMAEQDKRKRKKKLHT